LLVYKIIHPWYFRSFVERPHNAGGKIMRGKAPCKQLESAQSDSGSAEKNVCWGCTCRKPAV